MIRIAFLPLAILALSACAIVPDAPGSSSGPVLPQGSIVALGQPVAVADVVLTPMRIAEDSRCPINARCIWPGQIVVETRVDGAGWRETVALTLGETANVRGHILNLTSAEPGQMAGGDPVQPADYRFTFDGWPPNRPPE